MPPPRRWSDQELAIAKNLFCDRKWTTKQVARRFGLTFGAADGRLKRAGLKNNRYQPQAIDKLVLRYHAMGLNDSEMVAKISGVLDHDVYGKQVRRSRERQGLASNYDPVKHRAKFIVSGRRRLTEGPSGAEIRYERERLESIKLGWPPITFATMRVLQLFEAEGELDTETVAVRLRLGFRFDQFRRLNGYEMGVLRLVPRPEWHAFI